MLSVRVRLVRRSVNVVIDILFSLPLRSDQNLKGFCCLRMEPPLGAEELAALELAAGDAAAGAEDTTKVEISEGIASQGLFGTSTRLQSAVPDAK